MMITEPIPLGEHVPSADQRVVMHRVPWTHYEAHLALRGDAPVPRMSYLDGAMELMSPSKDHERIKSYIGRLVEAYAIERGIDLSPYGSWTLKDAPREAGVEPDECFIIGADQGGERPHLAIEVVWTSGGIDKLEAYRRLGVGEVWFWRGGAIDIFVLASGGYQRSATSGCLPDLDVRFLASYLDQPTVTQAVRAFRAALASRG
jgi:Uma2 family endonuclease